MLKARCICPTPRQLRCDHAQVNLPVATGCWRRSATPYNAFFVESFVDELAVALKKDPYLFRLELLRRSCASSTCFDAAASAAQWTNAAEGLGPRHRGWRNHQNIVCQVVDVEVIG